MPDNKIHRLARVWNSHGVGELAFCLLLAFGRGFLINAQPKGLHLPAGKSPTGGKGALKRDLKVSK